jgi:aminoglycoside phosphotransferase (APT) family kinase protein
VPRPRPSATGSCTSPPTLKQQVRHGFEPGRTASDPDDLGLEPLAPFTQLAKRVTAATTLSPDDRDWLQSRLADLEQRYTTALPAGLPHGIVHGDASAGNVVATEDGQVFLLDLERFSVGPPEWDLVATAIDHTTFGILSHDGYEEFCEA